MFIWKPCHWKSVQIGWKNTDGTMMLYVLSQTQTAATFTKVTQVKEFTMGGFWSNHESTLKMPYFSFKSTEFREIFAEIILLFFLTSRFHWIFVFYISKWISRWSNDEKIRWLTHWCRLIRRWNSKSTRFQDASIHKSLSLLQVDIGDDWNRYAGVR